MAARRACQSLSPDPQNLDRGPAMLPIKASYVTSRDRSSRATKSALSKSAERIRSDDECPDRAFGGSERAGYPTLLKEVVRSGRTAPGEPQCRTRDGAAGRVRRRRTHAARFPCGILRYLLRNTKAALRVERQSPHGIAAAGCTRCAKKARRACRS